MAQNAINIGIPIDVINGGTGTTSLTDHGLLIGSGTAAITATSVGSTNTVLQGTTGSDPSFTATPTVTSISFGDEALAYYDEGTWTPGLEFGGGSTGITYGNQTGIYTRIGNVVYCFMILALSNKGSDTGNATITGLPVASGDQGAHALGWRQSNVNLSAGYYVITMQVIALDTYMIVSQMGDNNGGIPLTNAEFANNSVIVTNFWYHA